MRSCKHFSNFHRTRRGSRLLNEVGFMGYGLFWLLCERVLVGFEANLKKYQRKMKRNTEGTSEKLKVAIRLPQKYTANIMGIRVHRLTKYLEKFQEIGCLEFSIDGRFFLVHIPGLITQRRK